MLRCLDPTAILLFSFILIFLFSTFSPSLPASTPYTITQTTQRHVKNVTEVCDEECRNRGYAYGWCEMGGTRCGDIGGVGIGQDGCIVGTPTTFFLECCCFKSF